MKAMLIGIALSLAMLTPFAAQAQQHGGGAHGGGGGGGPHGGGGRGPGMETSRGAMTRPAPNMNRSFDLDHDLRGTPHSPGAPAMRGDEHGGFGGYGHAGHGSVGNPDWSGHRAWAWNRGVVWLPAPIYWGGGFWGPFGIDADGNYLNVDAYGSFGDPATTDSIASYRIASGSPGAILLSDYGLTQTPCGPPNLVDILGPDNSVICANPNQLVGPGQYGLNSSNLTLVSQ